jgi:hypothetical protein
MSIKYRNFAHHIFASGRRRVLGFDGKPEIKESLEDVDVDGRILSGYLKVGWGHGLDCSGSG